ncbi:MAG: glycoside hydrolase family 127 protein [Acidobacteriota bacterium]|nr:glycoside hydrolase family 127 protein [Acidobacteriota bacterium]
MLSRRTLLGSAAAFAIAPRRTPAAPPPALRRRLREFAYSDVTLTGGPLEAMYRRLHAHYLSLDEDRILKVYRQRAGLPAPGRDMGGWYDADGFVPGHLIGQFISALSRFHAHTGDPASAAKARRLVEGYAAAFDRDRDPFAGPKASTWACYILDKYEIGLLDAATLARVDSARALLPRVIEAARAKSGWIPDHTFDRVGVKNPPYDEPYVLPENLFQTYALTADKRFLDLARLYLLDEFFDPLARGENVLPGKHGYSHIIALSSAAKAYEVLGDEKYLRAIRNAWDMLEDQQFASGAWAPQEMLVHPGSGELGASLTSTRDHFETPCCFYAHAKLARYLTSFTGEARYGDGLERVLFNTILGALDPDDDGGYFYYSDYQARAQKRYYQRKWPCCAGTLAQSVADYPLNLYFHDARGIYVNLYAASVVRWKTGSVPVTLSQHTAYPESEHIELRVSPATPAEFAVHLRIPGWLQKPAQISVNGKPVRVKSDPGAFATLARRWKQDDRIELTLPFPFRVLPVDTRNPDTAGVLHGPLMLVALNPPDKLAAPASALARMDPVPGSPLEFECRAASGPVRMRPFYQVQREPYSTYFHRTGDA